MNGLNQITIVILAKNEADMISECLASCARFTHRVVIDSGSTDATTAIAINAGAQVIAHPFTTFRDVRAFALTQVTTPWIFFVDADERPSPGLIEWISTTIPESEWDGIRIPRHNILLGEWVRFSGWSPDYQLRLCRVAVSQMGAQSVHESIEVAGPVLSLPANGESYLTHYTCQDLAVYLSKINHYTSIEAQDRQTDVAFKTTGMAIISRSFGMFTQTLFHHKGYKDGPRGVIVGVLNMVGSLMLMIKIWEIRRRHEL